MKPIMFSGPMVRAILDKHKTQTRRVMKGAHFCDDPITVDGLYATDGCGTLVNARYNPGDILWVKETFQFFPGETDRVDEIVVPLTSDVYVYRADVNRSEWAEFNWKPSIYMPRKAARIFLKVTNVRVERLRDISEHDACDEGVSDLAAQNEHWDGDPDEYRKNFRELWDSINGKKHPWESNPWVWVYEFEPCEGENK